MYEIAELSLPAYQIVLSFLNMNYVWGKSKRRGWLIIRIITTDKERLDRALIIIDLLLIARYGHK